MFVIFILCMPKPNHLLSRRILIGLGTERMMFENKVLVRSLLIGRIILNGILCLSLCTNLFFTFSIIQLILLFCMISVATGKLGGHPPPWKISGTPPPPWKIRSARKESRHILALKFRFFKNRFKFFL